MQLDYRNLTPQTWTAYILMFNEANEIHLRNMDPRQRVEVLTALKDYGEKKGFGFPDKFNAYLPKTEAKPDLAKGAGVETAADEDAWSRAKAIVAKEYGSAEDHWPIVQRIFQSIKKGHVARGSNKYLEFLAALSALIKAKYKRKIPTGKFRQTKSGKPGAQIFRYVYTDEAAARGAQEGEHVNFQRQGGVHEVTKVDHEGVTLKHAKSGQEKRLTHDEFHAHLANAYRREFDRGAEALIKRYVATAGKLGIDLDLSDPKATLGELRERFKAAGVEPEHAKRLVTFLAGRLGWHTDAKRALLALASDPTVGKSIAPRAKQIARGAENLSRAEGAEQVEERHVGRAIVLRAPGGGFDEKLTDLRHRAAMELAHTEALLGAVEAASGNEAMKRVMVDHAEQAMKSDAGRELEQMVTAYPGLRDVPELQRLQVARAKWQALQAERGAQRSPGKDGIQGAATTVYVSDADGNPTPQKARYRLIEADAATASHDPIKGFAVRKNYPEGVQERSYHRDKAEQEKVRRNAQGLEPAYIVNTNPDAVNGPPVMTRDGVVLGGNSRTMSLQLAYHQHPESAKGYRDYLREHAHEFGLAHTDLDGFKAPILVREVDVEDQGKANLGVLVRRYNESFTQGMDPRVDQVARGRMVTQGMLDSVASGMGRTNDAGEPLYGTLKEFLGSSDGLRFVSDLSSSREGKAIIDRRNRSQYVGKDGKLNEDGKTFVERVLVGHVIPDPDLLSDMLPKHVSAIAGVVPHVVSAAAKGHDVKAALKTAMDAHAYMRRKGLADVGEYERDSGGFASLGIEGFEQKPKLDAASKGLLGVLVDRIDKPVQLAGFFREFAKQARANPAGQANLLGESADTATLLGQAAGRSKAGQVDMFSKALSPAREYAFSGEPGDVGYQRAAMVAETIEDVILAAFSSVQVQPPATRRGKDADHPFEGFIDFQGIPIDVENLCGSERKGVDRDGHAWCVKMHAHYGEIRRSEGTDGDKLDVYVGPSPSASMVVVVDQAHPDTGTFDEQKVILGFDSEARALALYRKQYDRPGFYGGHRVTDVQALKSWLRSPESRGSRMIPGVRSSR